MSRPTQNKKLVFITSRFPFSLEKGDKLRAYYQLRELNKYFEVHLISLSDNQVTDSDKKEIENIVSAVHVFYAPVWKQWLSAILSLFSNRPVQVGYFHHKNIQRKIDDLLQQIQPDHIFCQLIRVSEYVKNYRSCPKTIDYMDSLSKGLERRLDTLTFPLKYIFHLEHQRVLRYENYIFDYFDYHTIISEQDRKTIPNSKRNQIIVIPNGVNELFFKRIHQKEEYEIVFTGNMSYPPNVEAAKFIVNKILPSLEPNVRVLISGASPVREIQNMNSERVTVTGWVDDIRKSYVSGKIFVAPMFIGSGLQNKLLEAMATGRPCITSPMANNALKAIPNKEILLASDPDEFRIHIIDLLQNKEKYLQIAVNGQKFVRENYDWENCTAPLIEIIQSANKKDFS